MRGLPVTVCTDFVMIDGWGIGGTLGPKTLIEDAKDIVPGDLQLIGLALRTFCASQDRTPGARLNLPDSFLVMDWLPKG